MEYRPYKDKPDIEYVALENGDLGIFSKDGSIAIQLKQIGDQVHIKTVTLDNSFSHIWSLKKVPALRKTQATTRSSGSKSVAPVGRPTIPYPDGWEAYYKKWKLGMMSWHQIIKQTGLSKSTFYRLVAQYEKNNNNKLV